MANNKSVALITGAAGGIGREVVKQMYLEGYNLALFDLCEDKLEEVKSEVVANDSSVFVEVIDINEYSQVKTFFDNTIKHFGRVDVLINLAGTCEFVSFDELDEDQWMKMLKINLISVFNISKLVSEVMIKQGGGKIINVSSSAGEDGGVLVGAHYAASKAGVINLTKSMAKVLAPHNITVNAVSPGPTETDMICNWSQEMRDKMVSQIPLGRVGKPDEVAALIMYLIKPASEFITGQVIRINGGLIV